MPYSTFDGHAQGIYIEFSFHFMFVTFVGKEVVLLLDLELSLEGKYLLERHFHGPLNQLLFENWSVSYATNM